MDGAVGQWGASLPAGAPRFLPVWNWAAASSLTQTILTGRDGRQISVWLCAGIFITCIHPAGGGVSVYMLSASASLRERVTAELNRITLM